MIQEKKITVSLVSCTDLSDKNGVVSFISHFKKLRFEFECCGIAVNSFFGSRQALEQEELDHKRLTSKIGKFKNYIREILKNNTLGSLILIYYSYTLRGARAYKAYKKSIGSDVVFFQDIFCFYAAIRDKNFKKASVVIFHSGDDVLEQLKILFPGARRGISKVYLERILRYNVIRANKIVTLSAAYKDKLKDTYNLNKFCTIYNTAFLNKNPSTRSGFLKPKHIEGKINLVCVGSAQFRKGYDLLISAISLLNPYDRERVVLHIAGSGDQLQSLKKLCELSNLAENVIFYGAVESPYDVYSIADIYCLPSRDEGLSISLIEAMSLSLPVFATPVGSIEEIFSREEYIRTEADVYSMIDSLKLVINNEYDLNQLGRTSREIFEKKLSNKIFVREYSKIFHNARLESKSLDLP